MVATHNPPAQWLRTFLGVARSGSFSEAADRLHMTQAAVSKHIRQLEHSYGVSLFVRHARGVELSEAGNQLYPMVHQAFELLTQAGDALQLDHQRQRVRLRCDATWAEAVLAPKLADFASCNPHIQLLLSTYIWLDELPRGHSDLHIAYGELQGYEGVKLSEEYAYVVCAPELKAKLDDSPKAGPINKFVLVGSEALWHQWHNLSAFALDGPSTISDSSIVCKRAAMTGHGLSIQRHSLVQHELNSGQLVKLDDIALQVNEGYYLLKATGRELPEAQQTVWDWTINNL